MGHDLAGWGGFWGKQMSQQGFKVFHLPIPEAIPTIGLPSSVFSANLPLKRVNVLHFLI